MTYWRRFCANYLGNVQASANGWKRKCQWPVHQKGDPKQKNAILKQVMLPLLYSLQTPNHFPYPAKVMKKPIMNSAISIRKCWLVCKPYSKRSWHDPSVVNMHMDSTWPKLVISFIKYICTTLCASVLSWSCDDTFAETDNWVLLTFFELPSL